jgi:Tfp pilus assembly protein PilX
MLKNSNHRGAALLVCIFVMVIVTAVVVAVLETQMIQMTALRHTIGHEQAQYLAGAGAHHALAELEAAPGWRTGIPATEFPAGSGATYSATAVDGGSGTVIVTGIGTADGVTRKVEVTVETE